MEKDEMIKVQNEIKNQVSEEQRKYVYYLVALCVTAIGFSVYQTLGKEIKLIQIPLALAVLSWGLSIHFAFIFLKRMMVIKEGDARLFEMSLGNDPMLGSDPSRIEYGTQTLYNILLKNIEHTAKRFGYQTKCFYSGMILFIIWHVLEMVCASKNLVPNCFFCQ